MGGGMERHDGSDINDKGLLSNIAHGLGGGLPHGSHSGYPPQHGAYPPQGYPPQGYPPAPGAYPSAPGGYPGAYPSAPGGYPSAPGGYPGAYPQAPGGYPPQGYPGYPPQQGYPPHGYPPAGYPGQSGAPHQGGHGSHMPPMGTMLAGGAAAAAAAYGIHALGRGSHGGGFAHGMGPFGRKHGKHGKFKHGKHGHGMFGGGKYKKWK